MMRYNMLLYIDPGTGSMLVTVAMGLLSTLFFGIKDMWYKMRFKSGKVEISENEENIIIFSDDKRYWNIFEPICDELNKRKINASYWTMSKDDMAFKKKYDYIDCNYIGNGNKAYAKLNSMRAKICLATTPGLDVYQWKKSKYVKKYVHIFHTVDEGTGYRMFGMDFYDAILLTGEFQEKYIRELEQKRNMQAKETKVVGSVYLDRMQEKYEKIQKEDSKVIDQLKEKTILLAPSWGQDSILNKYGEKILSALVSTGYHIIVRPHPETKKRDGKLLEYLQKKYPDSEKFNWNEDVDNFKCLMKADLMITDFSGIIFDYTLIFDKPLLYADTNLDTAPYDAAWIEEEVWRLAILPELGERISEDSFENMKEIIDQLTDNEKYKKGRDKIRETAWQKIGESAKLTADYLEESLKYYSEQ